MDNHWVCMLQSRSEVRQLVTQAQNTPNPHRLLVCAFWGETLESFKACTEGIEVFSTSSCISVSLCFPSLPEPFFSSSPSSSPPQSSYLTSVLLISSFTYWFSPPLHQKCCLCASFLRDHSSEVALLSPHTHHFTAPLSFLALQELNGPCLVVSFFLTIINTVGGGGGGISSLEKFPQCHGLGSHAYPE